MHIHSLQSEFRTVNLPFKSCIRIGMDQIKNCKQNYDIGCFYRPPDTQFQFWSTLTASLEGIEGNDIIIMGDLNMDTLNKNDKTYQHLHSFCLALQLQGIVKYPTQITSCSSKCLDLILTNKGSSVKCVFFLKSVLRTNFSDPPTHPLISVSKNMLCMTAVVHIMGAIHKYDYGTSRYAAGGNVSDPSCRKKNDLLLLSK